MPAPDNKKTYIAPSTTEFVTEEKGGVRPATEEEAEETAERWKDTSRRVRML